MGVRVPSYAHGAVCLIRQGRLDEPVRPRVSVPSSFIANAHNELYYAFYTGKGGLYKKNSEP